MSTLESCSPIEIVNLLNQLCNNYIDIYTGEMTPEDILKGIRDVLMLKHALGRVEFIRWLGSPTDYRLIKLADQSEWIVRKCAESEHYIHIHPSRRGLHTVRFKGSTLKTVLLLKTNCIDHLEMVPIDNINRIRELIGLSPVKRNDIKRGLLKCFERFFLEIG